MLNIGKRLLTRQEAGVDFLALLVHTADSKNFGKRLGITAWLAFTINIDQRTWKCGGQNASPAFLDPQKATIRRGRYALLVAAMYACFDIDTYIHIANHQRRLETQGDG